MSQFTAVCTGEVCVALHYDIHMKILCCCSMQLACEVCVIVCCYVQYEVCVSLFAVMCISEAHVTSLWYAQVRFVSLYTVVCTYEVCVCSNFLFSNFFLSVTTNSTCPFVWCHWYFTSRMVCVHTHVGTHTHKFACFKQSLVAVGK